MSAPGPATPYLRVDVARLDRNLQRTAQRAAAAGVALRPHVKTHKTLEIARRQVDAGAVGITVATIGEAEVFAAAGFDDIFIAYTLWLDERSGSRVRALADAARITVGVESVEGAANVGRLAGGAVEVLVELDSGQHRTGVRPDRAAAVAVAAVEAGLDVRGLFTFPGHSYSPDALTSAAQDESRVLTEARAELRAAGLEPFVLSGGSTPSLAHADTDVVTELRPGVYAFGDAQQWELGVMSPDEISLTCRSTVVSHSGGHVVVDTGSKLLGGERAAYSTGFGRLPDHPDARVTLIAENRTVVDFAGAPLPPLGSQVDLVPNHVCAAVNLVDTLWADDGGELEPWTVAARGRND